MRLINRCSYSGWTRPGFKFQDQLGLVIAVLGHLALFQMVNASQQSTARLCLPSFGNSSRNALPKERCRGQDVISLVPEKDRGLFVYYHLAKAFQSPTTNTNLPLVRTNIEPDIPNKTAQTFKDIRTYDTFPADLLKWTMQTFECSQLDVYGLLLRPYRRLCTSKGLCFSPNDIGSMCCPF